MGVGGQCHTPATLPPGKRPVTHSIGGWVGPRAGLDGGRKSRLHWDLIPRTVQPVACHYIDFATLAHAYISSVIFLK
jgi:hypothetical protein